MVTQLVGSIPYYVIDRECNSLLFLNVSRKKISLGKNTIKIQAKRDWSSLNANFQ